jgi:hypothetical protein
MNACSTMGCTKKSKKIKIGVLTPPDRTFSEERVNTTTQNANNVFTKAGWLRSRSGNSGYGVYC